MRCRDKQSCQNWYERELKQAGERLEQLRNGVRRFRLDLRPEWEQRLDEVRGCLNRSSARLEALRRSNGDGWRTSAVHAEEAFTALSEALDRIDEGMKMRPLAA